jgi:hypothetical protein
MKRELLARAAPDFSKISTEDASSLELRAPGVVGGPDFGPCFDFESVSESEAPAPGMGRDVSSKPLRPIYRPLMLLRASRRQLEQVLVSLISLLLLHSPRE